MTFTGCGNCSLPEGHDRGGRWMRSDPGRRCGPCYSWLIRCKEERPARLWRNKIPKKEEKIYEAARTVARRREAQGDGNGTEPTEDASLVITRSGDHPVELVRVFPRRLLPGLLAGWWRSFRPRRLSAVPGRTPRSMPHHRHFPRPSQTGSACIAAILCFPQIRPPKDITDSAVERGVTWLRFASRPAAGLLPEFVQAPEIDKLFQHPAAVQPLARKRRKLGRCGISHLANELDNNFGVKPPQWRVGADSV